MAITISQLTHSTKPKDIFEPPFATLHYFVSEHIAGENISYTSVAVSTDETKGFTKSSKWAYLSQKCRHEVAANRHFQTLKGHIPPMRLRLQKKRNLAMIQRTIQFHCHYEQCKSFKQLLGRTDCKVRRFDKELPPKKPHNILIIIYLVLKITLAVCELIEML